MASYSLDWFAAQEAAMAGTPVRRVGWTDRWLTFGQDGLWYLQVTGQERRLVKATDYGPKDLNARDWTTEAFTSDVCQATPAYNTTPVVYGAWTDAPIFTPPPAPGFAEEDEV